MTSLVFAFSSGANELGVKYSNDKIGQDVVTDMRKHVEILKDHVATLNKQITNIESTIAERQNAIDYIERQHEHQYFTVNKGSFKGQLAHFADRLQIKTIRWAGVPKCIDWELDATYDIDMTSVNDAIDEFLDGMPLTYQYFSRDSSLNLTSTKVFDGCPNE